MTDATPAASPLRRRMIDDMSLRNLSPATHRSYIHAVKRFTRFHDRSGISSSTTRQCPRRAAIRSGYGSSGPFRQALSERGLRWAWPDIGRIQPVVAKPFI
jgi:hypothetical protein